VKIRRIIPEINSSDLEATRKFYAGLLGLTVDMEDGDFLMFSSAAAPNSQLVVNDNGHRGLPPGFAIDVDTADSVTTLHDQCQQRGLVIVEPLDDKPWGIRRFSVLDPNGVRVTIIGHVG